MKALESTIEPGLDQGLPDEDVVRRVRAGETDLYEIIMRRIREGRV